MNLAGQLQSAARQLINRGTQVAELLAASTRTALGTLSHTALTLARPGGVRGGPGGRGDRRASGDVSVGRAHRTVTSRRPLRLLRTDDLPPTERGLIVADARTVGRPILLVHGFSDNRSAFTVLARALRKRGFGVVYGLNYSVLTALTGDVRGVAGELRREVERICEATNAEQVHVV